MAVELWITLESIPFQPAPELASPISSPFFCVFLHPGEAQFFLGASVGFFSLYTSELGVPSLACILELPESSTKP